MRTQLKLKTQDGAKKGRVVLVFTDEAVLSISQVFETITELGNEGVQGFDPLVHTSASLLSNSLDSSFFTFL
ncbi:hypothetical protein VIGAN_06075000 [Vigna angularis var. angularis]|uniref:Uncharacterized protein n=1 Tax=Vigna angularis var. angularis TaxID=157739 RepID=A0A0S3SA14_PHAAN|nr:hypothetical protein VIGAN_06075000 [Vigna angularis var. angularis]